MPLVLTPDGQRLVNPDVATLAAALGHKTRSDTSVFDLAIVGAGPAGLAAAVYGASEGLSTVCIEEAVPGGQAGQSSRIENYLGFPSGIAGADLARRAVTQARRFHVELLAPVHRRAPRSHRAVPPRRPGRRHRSLTCGALILACGVAYRTLDVPGAHELEGSGVFYGAALSERDSVAGEEIVVVGGANSAGQAAVFFSEHAKRVTILCRAESLGEKMSAYLVEQIADRPNIEVRCRVGVRSVDGNGRLERVTIEHLGSAATDEVKASAMFVFIGAAPRTPWLPPQIVTDELGFVLTGPALGERRHPTSTGERDPFLYETSVPGVFAVGDCARPLRQARRLGRRRGFGRRAVRAPVPP